MSQTRFELKDGAAPGKAGLAPWSFYLFLAAAVFFLYFFGLGRVGLLGPDEPRYAQVAREMLHSRDYVTPRLNGQPWFEKPPLYYWMASAAFSAFGVNEWAARLPAALTAAAFLPLFGWAAGLLFPGQTARYASLVLAASAGWIGFARAASPEILFTCATAGALAVLGVWVWHGRAELLYVFYALLAFALLAKGLGAIVLTALTLGVYCLVVREYRWLLRVLSPGPVLLCAVLALPWYVLVYLRNGAPFFKEFIWRHHFRRFLSEELAHPGPWWYYLPVLLALVFPWTPHLALIVVNIARLRWGGLLKDHRRIYLLAWIIPTLVFFSASRAKLPGYVLVIVPALALWIGNELANAPPRRVRWVELTQALLLPPVLILAQALPAAVSEGIRASFESLGMLRPDHLLVALGVIGFVLLLLLSWRGRRLGSALTATVLVALATARILLVFGPQMERLASARPLAREIQARGIPISQLAVSPYVRRHIEYGLEFYLDQPLPRSETAPFVVLPDGQVAASKSAR